MKAGIITFHRALNYGALLQAFALQRVLKLLDIESEIIDYRNALIEKMYKFKSLNERKGVNEKIKYFIQKKDELRLRDKFEQFRNNQLRITKKAYYNREDLKEISDSYDFYITGSDQVWNYNAHAFDKNYFLDFTVDLRKRMSYAASFGVSTIPEQYRPEYMTLLNNIPFRSVREEDGQKLVKNTFGLDSKVVLDPTLLLTKMQWTEIATADEVREKYILVYCFELTDTLRKLAEELSHETGLTVYYFGKIYRNPLKAKCVNILDADPFDFVRLFINAQYIITNSFHGTAFSINLNKPFFIELLVESSSVNSRLENIIQLTGLESRLIRSDYSIKGYLYDKIDWDRVNRKLDEKRFDSIAFLKEAFNYGRIQND